MNSRNGAGGFCVVLGLAWALVACNSTGVGNPPVTDEVSFALTNDDAVEPNATDETQLESRRIEHAVIVLEKFVVRPCDSGEPVVVLDGPFVVDLATNRVEPSIPSFEEPSSHVCGIDAILGPARAPAALAGRSIFFSGTRSDGARFLLFADMPGTLRMRPNSSAEWSTEHDWLWAVRPRRWLSPAELDASDTESMDGEGRVIVINVNRHPLLYAAIRARLSGRSSLHLDLDDNFELDDEERSGEALMGLGLENLD